MFRNLLITLSGVGVDRKVYYSTVHETHAATMEGSMRSGKTTENAPTIQSRYSTPGNIPKGNEICIWKSDLKPYIYSSTITNIEDIETIQISVQREMHLKMLVHLLHLGH